MKHSINKIKVVFAPWNSQKSRTTAADFDQPFDIGR